MARKLNVIIYTLHAILAMDQNVSMPCLQCSLGHTLGEVPLIAHARHTKLHNQLDIDEFLPQILQWVCKLNSQRPSIE